MNIFSHLLFFCGITCFIVGVVVLFFDKKAALNRTFFMLTLSLFMWSFFSAISVSSPDKADCIFWNTVASLGYCTFASVSLHFFLIYSKKEKLLKKSWIYFIIYLPAVILIYKAITHDLFIKDYIYSQFGWISIIQVKSIWFIIFMLTFLLSGTINIYLCFSMIRKATSKRQKKQNKVIFISSMLSFTFTFGIVFSTKVFMKSNIPDITVIGLMIWILGILYAIAKYRLMILTPSFAADSILKTILDSVILVNPKGNISYFNNETLSLLGYENADLLDKPFEILFPNDIKPEFENIVTSLESDYIRNKETVFLSKNNTRIPILLSAAECNNNDGDFMGFVALSRDISEYKQREAKIKYLSYHDQLTGLYNRRFYEEELNRLDEECNLPLSIIMGDVNGLKIINDSLGHIKGDELLIKVARAITNGCRTDDIIARIGGDEFVVLLPKTDNIQTEQIIKKINNLLEKEKVNTLDISVSFGYEVKKKETEKIQDIFKNAEDKMYKYKRLNSSSTSRNTIDLIMNALYEKNHREMLHSKRVSELCESIALKMDFKKESIYKIKIAGLMHDIGKIGIADETLNKPDELNNEEWVAMKKHPEIGQKILSAANEFSEIGDYIFEHQEKWDGTGYPRGLKGDEILLQARIITIADSYDAMTSRRNYGKQLSEEEAILEIKRCSGTQFDPTLAKFFVEKVLGKTW